MSAAALPGSRRFSGNNPRFGFVLREMSALESPATLGASLPWYDLEEVRPANDALWAELASALARRGLGTVPDVLVRDVHLERQWGSAGFVFGQACGYDALISHRASLHVVATPKYRAPGCDGALHRSFVVVREDAPFATLEDLRGSRCAFNNPTSHSGRNALRSVIAPLSRSGAFFSEVLESTAHEKSVAWIRERRVDVAAIDCVTHALLALHRPQSLEGLRVLAQTPAVPAPPFVTSRCRPEPEVALLREVLAETLATPRLAWIRDTLLLDGVETLPLQAYASIELMEKAADAHGYDELVG